MPIALMFPFAEAAGITLTGLGIAKATDIIMNYIQANPEKSKQILSTLMPNVVGIGSMLMKKKSEGTSDEEQPTEQKDTRSKKEIVLDAIREGREGRGNYSSPDAEGPAVSIRGNVIRGLEEAGEVSKERKTPEEMEKENKTKKPFDYKKFYKADGGRIGLKEGGGLEDFKIGEYRPFKYTGNIDDLMKADLGDDRLSTIVKIGLAVRAPFIDVIRGVAKTTKEAANLISAATEAGYDLTKPIRETIGNAAGGIYDIAKKTVQESGDASRFIQPLYYMERFGPEKNLTDDETRLRRLKRSTSRDDKDLIKKIENRMFDYDSAGIKQNEEDKKISNEIQSQIDSGNFGFANGGRIGYQVGGAAVLDYLRGVEGSDATDGRVNYASDSTEKLIQDYMNATQNRTNRLANPNKIQDLINRYTGGGQRTYDQMIGSGQGDIRGSRIPFGIGSLLSQILPDRYYDMSLGDQAFTQSQMGYTGPTVFGQNTGNQDPFGINVRSAFGNYGEAVQKEFDSLNSSLNDRLAQKYGVTFDPNRGIYLGENADIANRQTQMMRDKFNFRKDQLVKRADIDSRSKAAIANKEKIAEIIRDNKQYFSGPNATTPTNNNDRRNTSNDTNPNPSTPGAQDSFSNTSGKGRTGYFFGGRIGFVEGGDVMEETSGKNLSDYISGQGQYTSGSKTPEPGVKIKEELSNFIFNLNIPLNEKIKLLGQLSTSNSRVVEDLKGIGYNKNVYKDKFDSKKIGVQYDNDGFTIGGMYDPENKSKDLFINYKKSFKEGGLISMFREKR
jgi:hypothetical protein